MKSQRSAAFLHSAAAALERVARRLEPRAPSMADECEAMRRELEAEARAEFGLRNVEFRGCLGSAQDELASRKPASGAASEYRPAHGVTVQSSSPIARRQSPTYSPDPASPGDVWPAEGKVTPFVRKLRGVK